MSAVCSALAGLALFKCLAANPACLPTKYRDGYLIDLAAIAEQESGFRPWALRDDTPGVGETVFLLSREALATEIVRRLRLGRLLGVGMFQITGEANWRRHGLTSLERLTDPCLNMAAGAEHWVADLRRMADQTYNSGRPNGAPRYAAQTAERRLRLAAALESQTLPTPLPAPSPPLPAAPRARRTAFERGGQATLFSRWSKEADPPAPTTLSLMDRSE